MKKRRTMASDSKRSTASHKVDPSVSKEVISPREFQAAFFRRMGLMQQFRQLFEHLPGVDFFAKDAEGRFVAVGAGTLWRIGAKTEEELLGVNDATIHPPNVAKAIREDDLEVMRTRRPLVNRVEALYTRSRAKDWYVTTKLPILDVDGNVIGIMGFVRPYHGGIDGHEMDPQVERVVFHIRKHYGDPIVVEDLARIAHLSQRQLNRRFQAIFRISAQEFLVRTRIQAACDMLLDTNKSVGEIASEHGFCDQSAFTRQFRQHIGETPLVFRRSRIRMQERS
jgi:AraC-like DNA-binding protein